MPLGKGSWNRLSSVEHGEVKQDRFATMTTVDARPFHGVRTVKFNTGGVHDPTQNTPNADEPAASR